MQDWKDLQVCSWHFCNGNVSRCFYLRLRNPTVRIKMSDRHFKTHSQPRLQQLLIPPMTLIIKNLIKNRLTNFSRKLNSK